MGEAPESSPDTYLTSRALENPYAKTAIQQRAFAYGFFLVHAIVRTQRTIKMPEKYHTRAEASDYIESVGLPCTKATLGKLASTGGGPAYRMFGNRAVYTLDDLNAWIDAKLSAPRRSTSKNSCVGVPA